MGLMSTVLQQGSWAAIAVGLLLGTIPALVALWYVIAKNAKATTAHTHAALQARRDAAIVEASGEGIFELDNDGVVRYANPSAARMLGYAAEDLLGVNYNQLVTSAEHDPEVTDAVRAARYTTDMRRGVGAMLKRKDGRLRPVEYRVVPLHAQGRSLGTLFTFADISERVRTEAMLQDMQATAKVGAWEYYPDNDRLIWSDEMYRIHEMPLGAPLDFKHIYKMCDPGDESRVGPVWRQALEEGRNYDIELKLQTARGRTLWVHVIGKAERFNGRTLRIHGIMQDVTDRRTAEYKLRETRDFFASTLDAMPVMVLYVNADGAVTYCNKQTAEWWRRPMEQIVGRQLTDLVDADYYSRLLPRVTAVMTGKPQSFTESSEISGRRVDWQVHCIPETSADGRVRGFFSLMHDLSEIKRLEARLVQAQKMEAVGQLTGGIAHDFNNLLGVVIGNLQLLERSMSDQPLQQRKVSTAMRAAMRGADLTRRLLAFARRQILEPEVVDLNRHLKGLDELLHRTLGESIEVRIERADELWLTRVDPGQIESAILNLAINARDAMPDGGTLTIATHNRVLDAVFCADHTDLEPGHYVCVSVSDTGAGIDTDTLKSVFEPFFTTKDHGKGTGLGLSMVLGFAKQSGGTATIESQVGKGTTVSILLPRCTEAMTRRDDTGMYRLMPGGRETILVVEDDADLRETSSAALHSLGYRIIQARNPEHALEVLSGDDAVDLLFTDIMMPGGMLGPTLAQRARELRPAINVLFTTGYANNHVLASGASVSNSDVLPKPFRTEDLAQRIRHLLDREVRVA
jgi:PAS domain S-box-containing protein